MCWRRHSSALTRGFVRVYVVSMWLFQVVASSVTSLMACAVEAGADVSDAAAAQIVAAANDAAAAVSVAAAEGQEAACHAAHNAAQAAADLPDASKEAARVYVGGMSGMLCVCAGIDCW